MWINVNNIIGQIYMESQPPILTDVTEALDEYLKLKLKYQEQQNKNKKKQWGGGKRAERMM